MQKEYIAGETILIADDASGDALSLCALVSSWGRSCIPAATTDLYASVERLSPALILIDADMPGLDGFAFCCRLRGNPVLQDIPVLFLAADTGICTVRRVFDCGGTDLVAKPFEPAVLRLRVDLLMERRARPQTRWPAQDCLLPGVEALTEALVVVDAAGLVVFLNAAARRMTGLDGGNAIGMHVDAVVSLCDDAAQTPVKNPVLQALDTGDPVALSECLLARGDGLQVAVDARAAPVPDDAGRIVGGVLLLVDVTAFRTQEKQMRHLIDHDALTDLPNRLVFPRYVLDAIHRARGADDRVALYVLDLDQFKKVNEAFGHATGDLILREIAQRLRQLCGPQDILCRHGADEFLMIAGNQLREAVEAMAREMLLSLSVPILVNGARHDVTASVGVAIYPQDSSNAETLYHHAHSALYQAKRLGGNRLHFYSAEEERANNARHLMERRLRVALDTQQYELFYQPKMDGRHNCMVGAEALLRLRDEDGGIIAPGSFIPLAEETGMIIPIGTWVLREAFAAAGRWHRDGYALRVAVNISAVQFQEPDFYDIVREALDQSGAVPSLVELEITEGVLATQTERSSRVLKALKGIGVQISLDDFGTGYSSLSYLKKFPIDVIKIDQSFVRNMLSDASDATIVEAVVRIAESMKLRLVAEGVESRAHVDALLACGCVIMQGYFFSRPIPHTEMCRFLEQYAVPCPGH